MYEKLYVLFLDFQLHVNKSEEGKFYNIKCGIIKIHKRTIGINMFTNLILEKNNKYIIANLIREDNLNNTIMTIEG